jgi:hypothetical protein
MLPDNANLSNRDLALVLDSKGYHHACTCDRGRLHMNGVYHRKQHGGCRREKREGSLWPQVIT